MKASCYRLYYVDEHRNRYLMGTWIPEFYTRCQIIGLADNHVYPYRIDKRQFTQASRTNSINVPGLAYRVMEWTFIKRKPEMPTSDPTKFIDAELWIIGIHESYSCLLDEPFNLV